MCTECAHLHKFFMCMLILLIFLILNFTHLDDSNLFFNVHETIEHFLIGALYGFLVIWPLSDHMIAEMKYRFLLTKFLKLDCQLV